MKLCRDDFLTANEIDNLRILCLPIFNGKNTAAVDRVETLDLRRHVAANPVGVELVSQS